MVEDATNAKTNEVYLNPWQLSSQGPCVVVFTGELL